MQRAFANHSLHHRKLAVLQRVHCWLVCGVVVRKEANLGVQVRSQMLIVFYCHVVPRNIKVTSSYLARVFLSQETPDTHQPLPLSLA